MAVSAEVKTISSTALALNTDADVVSGTRLFVKNKGGAGVDLGASGVTAGAGYPLATGESLTFQLAAGEILYAIRSTGADVDLGIVRTGV
jgi:hypothetical protein